jgi:hypothetical protein
MNLTFQDISFFIFIIFKINAADASHDSEYQFVPLVGDMRGEAHGPFPVPDVIYAFLREISTHSGSAIVSDTILKL